MIKDKINFLKPLKGEATKSFKYDAENKLWTLADGYKAGKYFDGFSYDVRNIEEAYKILSDHQNKSMFMIHGDFLPGIPLRNILRRKRADRGDDETPTLTDRSLHLVCFDVDGYQTELSGTDAIEEFIAELPAPFWESDYIFQYSASYGLFAGKTLKCHLFFWFEEAVPNESLRQWVKRYNEEKKWGDVLDPAVFVATQPIYTQRRICLNAADPITDFIGLIKKSGNLEWSPPKMVQPKTASRTRKHGEPYSLEQGIKKILTAETFHGEINKLALSLMSKGMAAKEIKATIKGLMLAAKENLTDQKRLADWKTRYDDIDRSVDSAFDLVDNPAQEDLLAWLKAAPKDRVLKEYAKKSFGKTDSELKEIVDVVAQRTGMDKRKLKRRLRDFRESETQNRANQSRREKYQERKKQRIYEVVINDHNYAQAAQQIAKILAASRRRPFVFVYGGSLSYISYERLITIRQMSRRAQAKKAGERHCRTPTVTAFRKPYHDLISRMGQDIRFIPQELGKEIACPEKLATVVALGNDHEHRELTGIIQCPFVTADWQVFDKQGYDPETGLYSMLDVQIDRQLWYPDHAYNFLKNEVLAEFPFETDLDAAVMIASMMALVQRPLLAQDPAGMPGFGVTAPVQSSGKTTLVNFAIAAVLKSNIPASNFSTDDEELSKYVLTVLRAGQPAVFFDQIPQNTELKSDVLAKAMSMDVFSGRLLGENRELRVATSAIWFFTGNNISFPGDFSTRIFPINLNPKMENPDTRVFARTPVIDWAYANRQQILSALISLIMAGNNAPRMDTGSRFKLWDDYIRSGIFAAVGIDINQAIANNKAADQDFSKKKSLMRELWHQFAEGVFTSRNVIDAGWPSGVNYPPIVLGEALEDILGKFKDSAKSVGKLLSRMMGRTYDGKSLSKIETDRAYWKIELEAAGEK